MAVGGCELFLFLFYFIFLRYFFYFFKKIQVRVLYFAKARELCGVEKEDMSVNVSVNSARELLGVITKAHPR